MNQPNTQRNHQTGQDASALLGGIPLFSDLTTEELLTIKSHAHLKSYRKHTVIIEKGDDTTSLYVLVSGKVKVFLANEEGVVAHVERGSEATSRREAVKQLERDTRLASAYTSFNRSQLYFDVVKHFVTTS